MGIESQRHAKSPRGVRRNQCGKPSSGRIRQDGFLGLLLHRLQPMAPPLHRQGCSPRLTAGSAQRPEESRACALGLGEWTGVVG